MGIEELKREAMANNEDEYKDEALGLSSARQILMVASKTHLTIQLGMCQ